jgi:serine/threonine protein kinase
MRDLIRQIVEGYKSLKLEGQHEGYVLFSGQDPDTRQAVQIKILPRLLGQDPQIAARFRRLSQAIRQLNHPNITPTQTIGEKAGLPYVVTRALERAQPLADKLNQPWAVDSAADLVMQVGQAMEHAYNKGIVHGSLSPQNIVVQDNGRVAVTDFGLAELLDLVGVQIRQAASPFLAPERLAGKPADARADVYSLAALLYSLLAKKKPQVVQGQVLPLSRFNPDVPPDMDKAVVKALSPNPADRYPDVKSFLVALGATTLVPAAEKALPVTPGGRCPRCGAENQGGRFCRKCGTPLAQKKARPTPPPPQPKAAPARPKAAPAQPKAGESIQVTTINVGHIEVGKGVDLQQTTIVRPLTVTSGELSVDFPEPLEMPNIDTQSLWSTLRSEVAIPMPEPPPMPVIDWADIAPPMPEVPSIEDIPISREDR